MQSFIMKKNSIVYRWTSVLQVRNLPPRIATFLFLRIGGQIATWICYVCPHKLSAPAHKSHPKYLTNIASSGFRGNSRVLELDPRIFFFFKLNTVIIPYRIRLDRERDRLFSRWQNGFHFQQGKATIGWEWDRLLLLKHVITIGLEIGSGDNLKASSWL